MPESGTIHEFADLTLDTRQRVLLRGLERIELPGLSYDLLLALVEAAPAMLTHAQIAARVWRGRIATPETLAQRVALLRRALGEDAQAPRYLRGLRGAGYQLIPPVLRKGPAPRMVPPSVQGAGQAPAMDFPLPEQPSVVVLPFTSAGEESGQGDFALGLTHDITTRVARAGSFFVIARASAQRFAGAGQDVREVGSRLGVRYVVQGHVQHAGSRLDIHVALADAIAGRELWAERFHRRPQDVFEVQEEVTDLIVGSLVCEVEFAERRRALLESSADLNAWSAYHRGCWHMYRFTPGDFDHAERYFQLAATLDPASSGAFAGLSFVHWQRAFLEISGNRGAEIERAFELARHSVSLDPHDPLARWSLGRAHLLRADMEEAISELEVATALNPSFALGQYTLGFALMHAGRLEPSLERAEKGIRLSPYDPMGFAMLALRAFNFALRGQYAQAAEINALAARQPNAHHHIVAMAAMCDALAGNRSSARLHIARVRRQAGTAYGAEDFLRAVQLQDPDHRRLVQEAFARMARWR